MSQLDRLFAKKLVLNVFLSSIGVNAVLGVWALLAGDFGETQGKILSTSFLVSAAMLSVLVNGTPLRRRIWWPLPLVAVVAAVVGILLFVAIIWTDPGSSFFPKLGLSALMVGGGGTLLGLLGLVPLRPPQKALLAVAAALIGSLVAISTIALWAETSADWVLRVIGVLSILTAAAALTLPVVARFAPGKVHVGDAGVTLRFCPSCGERLAAQHLGDGVDVVCPDCGLRAFLAPRAPASGPGHTDANTATQAPTQSQPATTSDG